MITGVVLVKNQEKELERCLKSLSWCNEIIVIDDNSTDDSAKIAKELGAKVFMRSLNGDFSKQRNFALTKVKEDWAFFVDADEVVSPSLANEVYQQTSQFLTNQNGFYINRADHMFGKRLRFGEVKKMNVLRLARPEKGEWSGRVHEKWNVSGQIGEFKQVLDHYPHQTVKEFLAEINAYSTIRALELSAQKKTSSLAEIIFKPPAKFIVNYIFKLGFLDGMPGLILAIMMSFHSFLVRGKLWQLNAVRKTMFS